MPPYLLQPDEVRHLADAAFGALQGTLAETSK
jgi:hypothetical protein